MQTINKYKWQILATILTIIFFILGISVLIRICLLNLLPAAYVAGLTFLLALLLAGVCALLFITGKNKKAIYIRRAIGMVLALGLCLVFGIGLNMISQLSATLSTYDGDLEVSNVIGVYVLADNTAEDIEAAKAYTFAESTSYDYDNSQLTVAKINNELGSNINIVDKENVSDIVDALYSGQVDAIILNTAYVSILEEQEDYADFSDSTKLIYKYEIVEEQDTEETEEEEKLPISQRPFVVYISGSDGLYSKLSTSRSDVNLLAVVNPVTKQVLLINTPRDYYVLTEASNYTQYDKLTHCGLYGTDCSMGTLGKLYGVDIEYYTQINFTGFSELIDAIGGVTVENEKSFTSVDGYSFSKGTITLSGDYALAYVRERQAFTSGDIQRGKNQMKVIKAIINKVMTSDTLLTNYSQVLDGLEGTFVTNITSDEMSELVKMQLSDGGDWNVVSYSVSGKGTKCTTYTVPDKKAYVMLQDEDDISLASKLIQKVYQGETISEEDTNTETESE